MGDVTQLLADAQLGGSGAAATLLPVVYDELRKLAACRLANEAAGQTLDATALVHEAYLRLVGERGGPAWDNRGHFFAAAAEAMRRILVESARRKARVKHGGDRDREDLDEHVVVPAERLDEILAIHEALEKLELDHPQAAQVVKLRYFVGFTNLEAAESLGISPRQADKLWAYARALLLAEMGGPLND